MKRILTCLLGSLVLFKILSCTPLSKVKSQYNYLQNLDTITGGELRSRTVKLDDRLYIKVRTNSLSQEQVKAFADLDNKLADGLPLNQDGKIQLPMLGEVQVMGLTRSQISYLLTEKLTPFIKAPYVDVQFKDFSIKVLGEVRRPGIQKFQKDNVTILDALASAEDLTDNASRKDIKIIRGDGALTTAITVDMRSKDLFQSAGYQLQPDDLVYVQPSDRKLRSLRSTEKGQNSIQIFAAISSLATALIYGIITFTR